MVRSRPRTPKTDPVCGMSVDPATTPHRAVHGDRSFYFCSAGCRAKFAADPARWLTRVTEKPDAAPAAEGAIYTCPMHPEVRQIGPGLCPICGMALEPVLASAEATPNHELMDMTRRFWIGLVLSVPVVVLEMGGHWLGLGQRLGQQTLNWVQLLFATPVVLWAGWPFFVAAGNSLSYAQSQHVHADRHGNRVAWLYSVIATLARRFPSAFRDHDGSVAGLFRSGGGDHRTRALGSGAGVAARAIAPAAPSARCSTSRPRWPPASRNRRREEVPLEAVAVGDRCAFVRREGAGGRHSARGAQRHR
jgi:Cu+-exporting ATPase